jgi:hypothetical protein
MNGDSMPFDYSGHRTGHPRVTRIVQAIQATYAPRRRPKGVLSWDRWWQLVAALPALRTEVAERRRRYPHSHDTVPAPSADWQIAELRNAGFREVAIVWQQMTDRVLLAVR